jgi:hypothetical protein
MQKASGAVHDWFNARGLWVRNQVGDQFQVGGDDTLLTKSDAKGAEMAGQAAHLSQQAIQQLLANGTTPKELEAEEIFKLVPHEVVADTPQGKVTLPLEGWNDDVLRDLCRTKIFPDMFTSASSLAVRVANPELVKGGVTH